MLLFLGLGGIFSFAFGYLARFARPSNYVAQQLLSYGLLLFAAWLAHYIMLRWVDHAPWSYVGLGREQLTPRVLAIGLALGALCILIPSGGLLLAHDLTLVTGLQGRHSWLVLAGGGVALFLPQSLAEEMISRGYLFAALRDGVGAAGALAATSIGFGLLHMANPGATAQSVCVVIFAGVFLAAILVATRSLYAAWMAHFAWNWSMAELLHSAVSGIRFPYSSYRMDTAGPTWLSGGAWGPEGGAAAIAGMTVGIAALVEWRRRVALSGRVA
ncbi:MAG: CPBP family intramembrane metalloprotease [Gemmatimonadaceae bacterium]|nr:CPBP family intramembrane metalloprotease [Gemmatimonadaceae bacterium]